jgi:hypothetical protein
MKTRNTRFEAGIVKRERVCQTCGIVRNTEEAIVQGTARQLVGNWRRATQE